MFAVLLSSVLAASSVQTSAYKDPKLSVDKRVMDLLGRMTLQEKFAQLRCSLDYPYIVQPVQTTGFGFYGPVGFRSSTPKQLTEQINAVQKLALKSRLQIPVLIFEESLHGMIPDGHTSFPQSMAMAATWDPELVNTCFTTVANQNKLSGIRQVLSPVINVVRDARWGRVEETYGEDPYLTSRIGVAFCKAFESNGVITTPKHYIANVGDGGRDSHSVEISERNLREIYLPPFEAVIKEAGARSVMCSYNSVNGEAAAASRWLLTDVLRGELGFTGFVISDWGAVDNVRFTHHQTDTEEDTAAILLNAGMDSEHPGVEFFGKGLEDAFAHGKISQKVLDLSVGRVLRVKFEHGLFENPFGEPDKAAAAARTAESQALAYKASCESIVLLKNDGTLPLSIKKQHILVLGDTPNIPVPLGDYSGNPGPRPSYLDGLKRSAPDAEFEMLDGVGMGGSGNLPVVPGSALTTPDGQPGLKAEFFKNKNLERTPSASRVDSKVDFSWDNTAPDPALGVSDYSIRWSGFINAPESGNFKIGFTSDDGFSLKLRGRTVVEDWSDHAPKLMEADVRAKPGEKIPIVIEFYQAGGGAVASLGWRPEGKLVDPVLAQIETKAKAADAIIVFGRIREGEGQDRAYLNLPGNQDAAIRAACETGKPVIVVIAAGAPVTMEGWNDDVSAILDCWSPGEQGPYAVAATLFGINNPSGKLPMTFPRTVGQCPLYYNPEPTGRGYDYVDSSGTPLFPFGHGLSYTTFQYSGLKIAKSAKPNDFIVGFTVTNTGDLEGDEVCQLYTRQTTSSVVRPLRELKAFKRVRLSAGESKSVAFHLGFAELSFLDLKLRRVCEPGPVEFYIGGSSADHALKGELKTVRAD